MDLIRKWTVRMERFAVYCVHNHERLMHCVYFLLVLLDGRGKYVVPAGCLFAYGVHNMWREFRATRKEAAHAH